MWNLVLMDKEKKNTNGKKEERDGPIRYESRQIKKRDRSKSRCGGDRCWRSDPRGGPRPSGRKVGVGCECWIFETTHSNIFDHLIEEADKLLLQCLFFRW